MSVFRPSAKVTTPTGDEWEIYAYKIKVGEPLEFDEDPIDVYDPRPLALHALVWLLLLIPRLVARVVQVVIGAARALRSTEWTIDAITYLPQPTVYTWTTTREFRGQVLAQVEGQLARGTVPPQRVSNAVYRGERRSAR